MKHELKIHPQHWERVFDGSKTFEIRKNDRGFQKGDKVLLHPWDPATEKYLDTGAGKNFCILERIVGDVYWIDSERVVFSLLGGPNK